MLNVHAYGAVRHVLKCACHQNVSLTESIAQLKNTDHTRSYDTKSILVHALHSVEAVWQVGPGAVSVSGVATEDDLLVLC